MVDKMVDFLCWKHLKKKTTGGKARWCASAASKITQMLTGQDSEQFQTVQMTNQIPVLFSETSNK